MDDWIERDEAIYELHAAPVKVDENGESWIRREDALAAIVKVSVVSPSPPFNTDIPEHWLMYGACKNDCGQFEVYGPCKEIIMCEHCIHGSKIDLGWKDKPPTYVCDIAKHPIRFYDDFCSKGERKDT